jgi:hypothetical protein
MSWRWMGTAVLGQHDGPAPRLLEAVAVGPALHACPPVEAPEVVHGGHVRLELAGEVLGTVGEQELEEDQ